MNTCVKKNSVRRLLALLITSMFFVSGIVKADTHASCNAGGAVITGTSGGGNAGTFTVPVTLAPQVQQGGVLIIDVSNYVSCTDTNGQNHFGITAAGTALSGPLVNYSGRIDDGSGYRNLPLNYNGQSGQYLISSGPLPVIFYVVPNKAFGGILVNAGDSVATLGMIMGTGVDTAFNTTTMFTLNFVSQNTVTVPVGSCSISSNSVIVNLSDYPANNTPVPLSVSCGTSQNLSYTLSGNTVSAGGSVFTNTAASSPATNIGIQLSNNGGAINAGDVVPLGNVGSSPVSLGLNANYALTGGPVTAGNVQSVINVTFIYQ